MKRLLNAIGRPTKTVVKAELNPGTWIGNPFLYLMILVTSFLFTACKKYTSEKPQSEEQTLSSKQGDAFSEIARANSGLEPQTLSELQQAQAATAKYQNINNAFADNYGEQPIVVMPNMGYHFLKAQFISSTFDFRKPAILVYNKKANGNFELVALEYAVPIDPQNSSTPPEGFTGSADEWDFNTLNSGWWTLHAWVWKNNPDGVFNMTNPLVIVQ
jgi:hypothetical protein